MKKIIFLTGIISSAFLSIFLLVFRYVRSFFPPPEISEFKIVGYSQYYGYPFYYDTLVFFILIFFPSAVFLVLCFIRKK